MKDWRQTGRKLLNGYGRLRLTQSIGVIGLAALLMVGLGSHWASANSGDNWAFTSPLPGEDAHHSHPPDDGRDLLKDIVDLDQLTADVLGISVEELQTARENGTRLDELIESLGLDEATVHQELKTAVTTAVQQAVADGKLTQEEADKLLNPPADADNRGHGPNHGAGQSPHHPEATGTSPSEGGTVPPVGETPAATAAPGSTPESVATQTGNTSPAHPENHGSHGNHAADPEAGSSQNAATDASASTTGSSSQNKSNNDARPSQDEHHQRQRPGR